MRRELLDCQQWLIDELPSDVDVNITKFKGALRLQVKTIAEPRATKSYTLEEVSNLRIMPSEQQYLNIQKDLNQLAIDRIRSVLEAFKFKRMSAALYTCASSEVKIFLRTEPSNNNSYTLSIGGFEKGTKHLTTAEELIEALASGQFESRTFI